MKQIPGVCIGITRGGCSAFARAYELGEKIAAQAAAHIAFKLKRNEDVKTWAARALLDESTISFILGVDNTYRSQD